MANDTATLRARLDTQLDDTAHSAWTQAEKEDLIGDALRNLYPKLARAMSEPIFPLVADTENYAVPTGVREVYRVEVGVVATDLLLQVLDGSTWYTYGDKMSGDLKLFVNKKFSDPDHYYIVHGFGVYDLTTNLIPDEYVPLVLASARVEAYRRVAGERARFTQWANRSQKQSVTVNELLGFITEAEREKERLESRMTTWRRPVPGRMAS